MRTGLIFGKFAPFHKGHEAFIREALKHCDVLCIIVNEHPELIKISASQRAEWIRTIVNDKRIFVIPASVPPQTGSSEDLKKANFEHLRKSLPSKVKIDLVFCNEWYGEHIAKDFGAQWIQIDPERKNVPISATMIREDFLRNSDFLDPIVARAYRSINLTP